MIPASASMTNRIIVFTSIFTIAAIALLAWFLIAQFRDNAFSAFSSVQQAHLFNLLGEVDVDDRGRLTGRPRLGDSRFDEEDSGWYWQATIIDSEERSVLRSTSLKEARIARVALSELPFDAAFQRAYILPDTNGILIRVVETEFEVGETAIRLQTTANFSQFQATIAAVRRDIVAALSAFGIGLLVLNALLIRVGLRPLAAAREQLVEVQNGKKTRLEGQYPAEIAPLAGEINSLIENNKRVVERARTQVGNLAHALKTPIAVLRNESDASEVPGPLVREQTEEMNNYVQNYLKRAQIAAQTGGAVFRSDALAVTEKLIRVMRKLNPDKEFEFVREGEGTITFAGEQSDLEEILGNLFENAAKWSKSRVRCEIAIESVGSEFFAIEVEDDGPGIPQNMREAALKRGKRLDEAVPGTGLGLSIVADTVEAYRGKLSLEASKWDGLKVAIELPLSP